MAAEDTKTNTLNQEPESDTDTSIMESESNNTQEGEIYTAPVYSSVDSAKILENDYNIKIDYNMVRYWARKFPEFLQDSLNIESGDLRLSRRDIETLKQILVLKETKGYNVDIIRREMASMRLTGLEKPTIMSNEMFATLLKSDGFQEFMSYYTSEMLKGILSSQDEKFQNLSDKIQLLLETMPSPSAITAHEEQVSQIEELQETLEERERTISELEKEKQESEENLKKLQEELAKEKEKSIWDKLFHR